MRRALMFLRHIASILLLPTTVTVVIPAALLGRRAPDPSPASIVAGGVVIAAGLMLVVMTIYQFATTGRGTLAPWDPPRKFVVSGIYRYVRNPMITGVLLILIGETVAFRARALAGWAVVFFAINATYIPLVEEPGLLRRFGEEYREYWRHVPRWIPRRTPWRGPTAGG